MPASEIKYTFVYIIFLVAKQSINHPASAASYTDWPNNIRANSQAHSIYAMQAIQISNQFSADEKLREEYKTISFTVVYSCSLSPNKHHKCQLPSH